MFYAERMIIIFDEVILVNNNFKCLYYIQPVGNLGKAIEGSL